MDLWTGLACVKLNAEIKDVDPFDGGKGAWSNVVAWVDSQNEFETGFGGMRKAWAISSLSLTRSNCWRLE